MPPDQSLDRRRFLALLGLAAAAPRPTEALELANANRLMQSLGRSVMPADVE